MATREGFPSIAMAFGGVWSDVDSPYIQYCRDLTNSIAPLKIAVLRITQDSVLTLLDVAPPSHRLRTRRGGGDGSDMTADRGQGQRTSFEKRR